VSVHASQTYTMNIVEKDTGQQNFSYVRFGGQHAVGSAGPGSVGVVAAQRMVGARLDGSHPVVSVVVAKWKARMAGAESSVGRLHPQALAVSKVIWYGAAQSR
jgi:hypothetical protein